MSDDVREARERVRQHANNLGNAAIADRNLLTLNDLREHPADEDEVVTEDWFETEFAHEEPQEYEGWRGVHIEAGCGIYVGVEGKSLLINNYHCSRNQSTRGDVRRLCAALGIPLKESDQVP